jgi:hypothetical protein
MELKEGCKASIYEYASLERQNTAAITGLYQDYVHLVIIELTGHYERLKEAGETEWSIPDYMVTTLEEMKPY